MASELAVKVDARVIRPLISTVLPRCFHLVSMASRAGTEEASRIRAAERSTTIRSG